MKLQQETFQIQRLKWNPDKKAIWKPNQTCSEKNLSITSYSQHQEQRNSIKRYKGKPRQLQRQPYQNNTDFSLAVLKAKKTQDNIFQALKINDYQTILMNLIKLLKLENKDISK